MIALLVADLPHGHAVVAVFLSVDAAVLRDAVWGYRAMGLTGLADGLVAAMKAVNLDKVVPLVVCIRGGDRWLVRVSYTLFGSNNYLNTSACRGARRSRPRRAAAYRR